MALSKEQLQRFKKAQAIAKSHCERNGTKLAHPIDFDLLEQLTQWHNSIIRYHRKIRFWKIYFIYL